MSPNSDAPAALPLSPGLNARLSVMMFLQYAIWGAWLPFFYPFARWHRGFAADEVGTLFALGAAGAVVAPFISGQIADRWFATERYLGISHLLGAIVVWKMGQEASFAGLAVYAFLYSLLYMPTMALSNALAFHHLPDRDRDFGRVRVWGTIGWIAVGIGIGQWLLHRHTPAGADDLVLTAQRAGMVDSFNLSAILSLAMGVYCFTLPHTPPQKGTQAFAPFAAIEALKSRRLWALFLIAFPVACIHQFYFVHTSDYLAGLQTQWKNAGSDVSQKMSAWINQVLGVGGGGVMTIGQMGEIVVLALMPVFARMFTRKTLLMVGMLAYILRFYVFAYHPTPEAVLPALALHGVCFGFGLFAAFMIVDEETTPDVRASAQSLFNLVIVGLGIIVGNLFAGEVAQRTAVAGKTDFTRLFEIPMYVAIGCMVLVSLLYPGGRSGTARSSARA
jgi:nucleoside transporter